MKRFLAALLLTLWAMPALGQLGPGGGSIGPSGGGGGGGGVGSIAVGTTAITGGTTGRVLYDNGGFVGEFALGTGVQTALGVNIGSAGAFITFNGALGTPSSGTLTNATGLPLSGLATQATNTVVGNATSGTASPTALAVGSCSTASSALIWTTNTGFGCNTSITANAVAVGGITGLGTGVGTALAINVGTAGAFVTLNGALGTPSSGTLTNATGYTIANLSDSAWGTYTSGAACGNNALTVTKASQKTIGKTVYYQVDVTLNATIGTCSNNFTFNVPSVAQSAFAGVGQVTSNGKAMSCAIASGGSAASCFIYDASSFSASNRIIVSGFYEGP